MVAANRDMLIAIAGVFFLLPGLTGSVMLPRPSIAPHMTDQQTIEAIKRFYSDTGPMLLLLSIPTFVGFLTMLKVMLDHERPTVGGAIMQSVRLLPSYIAVQVVIGFAISILYQIVAMMLAQVMPGVLAAVIAIAAMTYPMARVALVAPEIAVLHVRNPIKAIARSIRMTRGNVAPILLYFAPAFMLFIVAYGLVMSFVGVVLDQTTDGETHRLLGEAVVGVLISAGYTCFAAMIASVHRQLSGANCPADSLA